MYLFFFFLLCLAVTMSEVLSRKHKKPCRESGHLCHTVTTSQAARHQRCLRDLCLHPLQESVLSLPPGLIPARSAVHDVGLPEEQPPPLGTDAKASGHSSVPLADTSQEGAPGALGALSRGCLSMRTVSFTFREPFTPCVGEGSRLLYSPHTRLRTRRQPRGRDSSRTL